MEKHLEFQSVISEFFNSRVDNSKEISRQDAKNAKESKILSGSSFLCELCESYFLVPAAPD